MHHWDRTGNPEIQPTAFRLNVSSSNSYIEILTPDVMILGSRGLRETIKS